jgi:hypothetical protein
LASMVQSHSHSPHLRLIKCLDGLLATRVKRQLAAQVKFDP